MEPIKTETINVREAAQMVRCGERRFATVSMKARSRLFASDAPSDTSRRPPSCDGSITQAAPPPQSKHPAPSNQPGQGQKEFHGCYENNTTPPAPTPAPHGGRAWRSLERRACMKGSSSPSCSDAAQLHWPRLYLLGNGYSRFEVNYERIIAIVYASFHLKPTPGDVRGWLHEYTDNFLLFIYEDAATGAMWAQWITAPRESYLIPNRRRQTQPGTR